MSLAGIEQLLDTWLMSPWPSTLPFLDAVSPLHVPIAATVVYLSVIFGLRFIMTNFKPFELRLLLAAHNFFLCAWSLWMAAGISWTVWRGWSAYGWLGPYCGVTNSAMNDGILFWARMFYFSKFYELIDTLFLVLRKKPLTFLHVYHHAIVMFICWYGVDQQITMGWITTWNNTTIHVLMYFYYGLRQLGIMPWWRKLLTTGQIVQFMSDCLTSLPFPYLKYFTNTPCSGSLGAWALANAGGISFYILFTQFYREQYTEGPRVQAGKGGAQQGKGPRDAKTAKKSN